MPIISDPLKNDPDIQSIPAHLHDQLLEYVNQNCCNSSLCLNSVADYMCTSIYAISRTFKELTGVGFKEYVTGKRLQCACQLLVSSDDPIGRIASASGFENATYFTTVFKREFGIPPSRYRVVSRRAGKNQNVR